MQLTLPLLGLAAIALAAPAPTSNNDIANQDQDHVLFLIINDGNNNNDAHALSVRQLDRCDWDSYCLPEYQKCVKTCNSIFTSDW
jgi:hypothetical protein